MTAALAGATSSVAARRSGARLTNVEPGKIWGAVPAAPPLLGSTGSTTFVLVVLLVALGVGACCCVAVLARPGDRAPTPPRSGPLEVMGDRRFGRRDEPLASAIHRRAPAPRRLERPAPMLDIEDEAAPRRRPPHSCPGRACSAAPATARPAPTGAGASHRPHWRGRV